VAALQAGFTSGQAVHARFFAVGRHDRVLARANSALCLIVGMVSASVILRWSSRQNPGNVVSTYGWVLPLKNGRRLYLKYTLDGAEADRQ